MTAGTGRAPVRSGARDHEHVDRVSSRTIIFLLVAAAIVLYAIRLILLPFVIAGLLAYLCTPVLEGLTRRNRMPRSFWAAALFTVIVAAAAGLAWSSMSSLWPEGAGVVFDAQGTIERLFRAMIGPGAINVLGHSMDAAALAQAAVGGVLAWAKQSGVIVGLGSLAIGSIFGLFLTLVLLFYFLLSGPAILRGLLELVPPRQRPLIVHIWRRLDPVLIRYLVGVIIVVLYASAAAYVGLGLFLGIPHAAFLAVLTGFLEMLPVIGPGAAAVIAGLIAVRHATVIGPIVAYAVYATALRLSIDQLFGPLALGAAARMHPAGIIFCFLAGGILFGIAGVILAVPVALIIRTTLAILYDEPKNE